MISGQCDELRERAKSLRQGRWSDGPDDALMMEHAAERIAALEDENAKLKEHVRWLKQGDVLHVLTDQELADQLKHEREMLASITALDDENAKLRKLVRDMFGEIEAGGFGPMVERHGKSTVYYEDDPSWRVEIRERMRKLGIEEY